ncbi:hypothetical protein QTP88_002846 [Uroleucon formosanum]
MNESGPRVCTRQSHAMAAAVVCMPRYYKKKLEARTYANYSDASVEEALLKIAYGELSYFLEASNKYGMPYGTLHNR